MIDNGMSDWLLAVSPKNGFLIAMELIICAIHPIPGEPYTHFTSARGGYVSKMSEPLPPCDPVVQSCIIKKKLPPQGLN